MSEAPWLDVMLARQKRGIREIPGKVNNNPDIMSRYLLCGWRKEVERGEITDETPWCAAEIGGALVESGYPIPPKAVNLLARSYLTYGKKLNGPRRGAIGVMPRGKDTSKGHVVCCKSYDEATGEVEVVEGNKGDALVIGRYHVTQFLKNGWRWPVKATVKELRDAGSTEIRQADQAQAMSAIGTTATLVTAGVKAVEKIAENPSVQDVVSTSADIGPWDTVVTVTERIGIMQALLDVIAAAPWALAALAVCWLLWRWGALAKVQRVIRHLQGQAISTQIYVPDDDEDDDAIPLGVPA